MSAGEQLMSTFRTKDLYEILGVEKGCSQSEINSAYRKKALLYHPDKKGGNAELFRALSIVHSILSDEEKRKIYDETGDVDGDDENYSEQSEEHWNDYFRAMFPKITTQDIEKFSEQYIGSEEEKEDVINAYNKYDGYVPHMMETVILSEDESRLCDIIDEAIQEGIICPTEKYTAYVATLKRNPNKKHKKTSTKSKKEDSSLETLQSMILNKKSRQDDVIASILAKHGAGKKGTRANNVNHDIPDDIFEDTQRRLGLLPKKEIIPSRR